MPKSGPKMIVLTPEMVAAGAFAYSTSHEVLADRDVQSSEESAIEIFEAMARAGSFSVSKPRQSAKSRSQNLRVARDRLSVS